MVYNGRPRYGTIISYFIFNSILQFTGTFHYERHNIIVLKLNGSRIIDWPTRNLKFKKDVDYLLLVLLRISEEKKKVRGFWP